MVGKIDFGISECSGAGISFRVARRETAGRRKTWCYNKMKIHLRDVVGGVQKWCLGVLK